MGGSTIVDLWGRERGRDVYVLGTGTSLAGFPWSAMNAHRTIALNNAVLQPGFVPSYHLFSDQGIWTRYSPHRYDPSTILVCQRSAAEKLRKESRTPPAVIHVFKISPRPESTIESSDALFMCRTVACAGIHLAWKLGAARIFLLGIDAYRLGKDAYCDGTPKLLDTAVHRRWVGAKLIEPCHEDWIRDMARVRKDFTARGLFKSEWPGPGIYNLNPESMIDAWPRLSPSEVLGGLVWGKEARE